jgi:hypothetical protein
VPLVVWTQPLFFYFKGTDDFKVGEPLVLNNNCDLLNSQSVVSELLLIVCTKYTKYRQTNHFVAFVHLELTGKQELIPKQKDDILQKLENLLKQTFNYVFLLKLCR